MKRLCLVIAFLVFLLGMGGVANATNGDNLIAIGPIARSMGGVGVAAPQDAISAVFANPAAMCFGPYCPGSQVDFAGTVFLPAAHAKVQVPAAGINAGDRSQSNIFIIPAIGLSTPITPTLRFGLAAYGVSGMGTDYRDRLTALGPAGGIFTQYSNMKFAPNIAYMINDHFSVGANVQVDYASLDLGQGTSSGFGLGVQLGAIYKTGPLSLGLSYVTPQTVDHQRVYDFDGNNVKDDLKLQMPQTLGFGIGFSPLPLKKLLIEGDVKWVNWANAKGYKDFDWRDQYILSLGVQYKPIPKLSVRAGINYGRNPVKTHQGFNAASMTTVQGKPVTTFGYEYLRMIGFPAIVETHLTAGLGYQISENFDVNLAYTHGFEKTISETGTNFGFPGGPNVTLGSSLKEDSLEFGLSWRF